MEKIKKLPGGITAYLDNTDKVILAVQDLPIYADDNAQNGKHNPSEIIGYETVVVSEEQMQEAMNH